MELIKGCTLMLVTCALLWLGSELVVRGAGYYGLNVDFEPLEFSPDYGWQNKPNYDAVNEEIEWKVHYRTNADGFRGPQYRRERTPGIGRILVVADSWGDGFGVSEEEMWQTRLASELGGVEIVNQSVRGYDIIQEYKRYLSYGRNFDPDTVVHVLCDNDLGGWNSSVIARYQRFRPQYDIENDRVVFRSTARPPDELVAETALRKFKRIIYRSASVVYLKHRLTPAYQKLRRFEGEQSSAAAPGVSGGAAPPPSYDTQYLPAATLIFRDMLRRSREENFRYLVAYVTATGEYQSALDSLEKETDIRTLRISFPQDEMFVFDRFHPRAEGHRRIGRMIAEELRK